MFLTEALVGRASPELIRCAHPSGLTKESSLQAYLMFAPSYIHPQLHADFQTGGTG